MSEQTYTPSTKFGKWFNDRLPLLTLSDHLKNYPILAKRDKQKNLFMRFIDRQKRSISRFKAKYFKK